MKKSRESGFALLLVFLMAAVIAISLYMEIPRVAFQSQRQKEQLLIERGHEYQRAIQLFVKANGRYPAELKDLENFNNRRFLRHKFIDPMTGKDDWRLIHINNGVLTDSVLTKPKQNNQQASTNANQYVSELPTLGSTPLPGQQNMPNPMTRRRTSEGGPPMQAVGPDGQPLPPGQEPASMPPPPQPGQPVSGVQTYPGFPGAPPSANQPQPSPFPGIQPVVPGQPLPGVVAPPNPGMTGVAEALPYSSPGPGTPVPPELAYRPGANLPGQPSPTGTPFPSQMRGGGVFQTNTQPNAAPQSGAYVGGTQPYIDSSQPYIGGASQPTATNTYPVANSNPFLNNSGVNSNPVANSNPAAYTPPPPTTTAPPTRPVFPGMLGIPGVPAGVGSPPPTTASPGVTLGQTSPFAPSGTTGSEAAANMINNLLTTPRAAPATGQPGGQQIGGGIAGIASKSENPSIMVYNDHTQYNEWEFIFDYTKQQQVQRPGAGLVGTPASALGTPPGGAGLGTPAAALGSTPSIPGFGGAASSPRGMTTLPGFGGAAAAPGAALPGFGTATGGTTAAGAPSTGGAANPAAPGLVKSSPFPPGFRFGRP